MNLVSLRMIAVTIGAVGFIAACGSSGSSLGNSFAPVPGAVVPTDATAPMEAAPASGAAGNNAPAEAGPTTAPVPTCTITNCATDQDCSSCGADTWCCMAGTCYSAGNKACGGGGSDDAGSADESTDDSGFMTPPAPSM
jgi:hypothetical protein